MALPFFNTTGLFILATDTQLSGLFGVMSIIFGILILIKPTIINYLLAIYLILTGIIALVGMS